MRVLVTSFPARGHFHPIAPFALAVRDAGHEVRVASGADLAEWATNCGFDAHAVAPGLPELIALAQRRYGGEWSPHMFTDVWVTEAMPGLLSMARSWSPDLVVHEEEDYAGLLLATTVGLPAVTHSWHSPARARSERDEAERLLTEVWATYRPGATPRSIGDRYLDACPPPLQNDEIAGIDGVLPIRAVSFEGPQDPVPGWMDDLARPAVYLTLGTVPVFSTPERLRHLVDAIAPVAGSLVVTTGPNRVESLGPLPTNVHATPYLSQNSILDRVDLVVSQGGAGGTLGAIEHALPHLLLPFDAQSQLAAAEAIDRLGAGRALGGQDRSAVRIRFAVTELLDDPSYRASAETVRRQLDLLPSPAEVVKPLLAGL